MTGLSKTQCYTISIEHLGNWNLLNSFISPHLGIISNFLFTLESLQLILTIKTNSCLFKEDL